MASERVERAIALVTCAATDDVRSATELLAGLWPHELAGLAVTLSRLCWNGFEQIADMAGGVDPHELLRTFAVRVAEHEVQ